MQEVQESESSLAQEIDNMGKKVFRNQSDWLFLADMMSELFDEKYETDRICQRDFKTKTHTSSMCKLLRTIRNLIQHFAKLSPDAKKVLGNTGNLYRFIDKALPQLFITIYNLIGSSRDYKMRLEVKKYFCGVNDAFPKTATAHPVGTLQTAASHPVGTPQTAASHPVGTPQTAASHPLGTPQTAASHPVGTPQTAASHPVGTPQTAASHPVGTPRTAASHPVGTPQTAASHPVGTPRTATSHPVGTPQTTKATQLMHRPVGVSAMRSSLELTPTLHRQPTDDEIPWTATAHPVGTPQTAKATQLVGMHRQPTTPFVAVSKPSRKRPQPQPQPQKSRHVVDIKMDPSNPEGLMSLWVGQVKKEVKDKQLQNMFSKYGEMTICRDIFKNYVFVNYATKEGPGKAMDALQGFELAGEKIVIRFTNNQTDGQTKTKSAPYPNGTSLWVGNVQPEVSAKKLNQMFSEYEDVESVYCLPDKFCAFINFKTRQKAKKAMAALQGVECAGEYLLIKPRWQ